MIIRTARPSGQTILNGLVASGKYGLPILSASGLQIPSSLLPRQAMASPPAVYTTTTFLGNYNGTVTASVSGTTMTVTGVTSGSIRVGATATGTSITANSVVLAQLTGAPSGIGTYQLSQSSTAGSTTVTLTPQYAWFAGGLHATFYCNERFTFSRASGVLANTAGAGNFSPGITTTLAVPPGSQQGASGMISFFHDGQIFEIGFNAGSNFAMFKVDDQYISLTPTSLGASGITYYMADFGSVARRRIDVITGNPTNINFVAIGANDSLDRAPKRGPTCIFVGDSFTAGSGASGATANNFAAVFADLMGWDDVRCSGIGGTGYVATNGGANPTFGQRVPYDVIPYSPDIVWFYGSINDQGNSVASVLAAATSAWSAVRSALPGTVIVASMNAKSGVGGSTANTLQINAALKSAAPTYGVIWVDLCEFPLEGTADTVTLNAGGTAGQSLISLSSVGATISPVYGGTYSIDVGTATEERFRIRAYSSGNRVYSLDDPLQYNHSNGAVATRVGGSLWTGHGHVGAAIGWGNCDLYVGSDGTHPSDAGNYAQGTCMAFGLQNAFRY